MEGYRWGLVRVGTNQRARRSRIAGGANQLTQGGLCVDRRGEVSGVAKSKLTTLAFLKKDLNRLAAMLQEDEQLVTLASGTMVGKELVGMKTRSGVLAATDRRLLFCGIGQSTCLEFPLQDISGLSHTKKELEFDHGGRHVRVKGISPKERVPELLAAITGEGPEVVTAGAQADASPVKEPNNLPAPHDNARSVEKKVSTVAVVVSALIVATIIGASMFGGGEDEGRRTLATEQTRPPTAESTPSPSPEQTPTPEDSPSPSPEPEPKPIVVTSTCTDPAGDIEDGNYETDPNPPPGMDLTKVTVKSSEDGITVTYESTTPAVMKTPPGVDRLYWNISYGPGNQLLAKLVGTDWTVAQFDINAGQQNFDLTPEIRGNKMIITYPVFLGHSFKWGSNTEYGATNFQDFCPEDFGMLRHG